MTRPVGGRGHKAPYLTTNVRVPVPVKHIVEEVSERYRKRLGEGMIQPVFQDNRDEYLLPESTTQNPFTTLDGAVKSLDDAVEVLEAALKLKSNAGGAIKEEIRKALSLLKGEN